jgi:deoxyribonuclease-1
MRLNGILVVTVAAFLTSSAFAKINIQYLDQSDLKHEAAAIASQNHHSLGYGTARVDLLGGIALQKNGTKYFITDVYCEADYAAPGPGRIPSNNILNVEHTWPQSKFGGKAKNLQKSDLHHLFPSDPQLNSVRGNNDFGTVVKELDTLKCSQSKIGLNAQGTRVFEPPSAHKGNVARALFYFSVRYNMPINSVQEEVLKAWNIEDPVDADEMSRNDEIEKLQGNRNPFIDQPEMAQHISDF